MDATQTRGVLALAAVLGVLVVLLNIAPGDTSEPIDPDATADIWLVEAADVIGVTVRGARDPLRLERALGRWRLVEPPLGRADAAAVSELLDAISAVRKGVPIAPEPGVGPAGFGLGDEPEYVVSVDRVDGSAATLRVGLSAPVGWRTYVQSADGGIAAAHGDLGRALRVDVERLRDRRLLDFEIGEVTEISLTAPGGSLRMYKSESLWWLDGYTRADLDALDDLLVGLLDLRGDTIDEGAPEIIGEPSHTAVLRLRGGVEYALRLGDSGPLGVLVMAQSPEGAQFAYADPNGVALLGQGPTDLGDSAALPIDLNRDERLVISRGDQRWEAVRDGFTWQVSGVADEPVREAVAALDAAVIAYRREPAGELGPVQATVHVERGGVTRVVELGREVDGFVIARDTAGGETYRVPTADLAVLSALPQP